MTIYYRITDGSMHDLTAEQYAGMVENGKAASLRLWVPTVAPTPGATQVVVEAAPIVDATTATQAWALRDKTAAELEDDALAAELLQLDTLLANIDTQNSITNQQFNGMTTAQKFDVLRTDRNHVLRAVKFLLRRARRGF